MAAKLPILLSFYALSNGRTTLTFGQVTYTRINDLSFKEYSRRKTFRTLLKLYRTHPFASQEIVLLFTSGKVHAETNRHGAFYLKTGGDKVHGDLVKVLLSTGEEVRMVEGLYAKTIHYLEGDTIVVSDIDDTLVHSFIHDKILKFRTLMFTTMEKRKSVEHMQVLMRNFTAKGAVPIYLSNSEQNLYPLIYRFLQHNNFPQGPLFLKQMRKLWDVFMNVKIPPKNIHKTSTLEEILSMFPEKKFILMGDNTQHDLPIYLTAAEKYHDCIRYIIIRKVVERKSDEVLIAKAKEKLKENNITIYYADEFPHAMEI
ncbi:MAG TPA: App1 family protein [Chryseosolibacter sp.]|nr:App1 family protein [Chryseosolibacter sp.]